jgi:hypothetical protein
LLALPFGSGGESETALSCRPRPDMPWRGMCVSIAGDWGSSNPSLAISRGPCGALGLACSPEPPLHRHALVPIDFRHKVRRLTQKHLSQLLLPAAGIRPAVFHGAPFRSTRLSSVHHDRGARLPRSWMIPNTVSAERISRTSPSGFQDTCRPSPCGRLSRPPSTTAAPSPCASRRGGRSHLPMVLDVSSAT